MNYLHLLWCLRVYKSTHIWRCIGSADVSPITSEDNAISMQRYMKQEAALKSQPVKSYEKRAFAFAFALATNDAPTKRCSEKSSTVIYALWQWLISTCCKLSHFYVKLCIFRCLFYWPFCFTPPSPFVTFILTPSHIHTLRRCIIFGAVPALMAGCALISENFVSLEVRFNSKKLKAESWSIKMAKWKVKSTFSDVLSYAATV